MTRSTVKFRILWDAENCPAKDFYFPARRLKRWVRRFFPGMTIQITAYAKKDKLTPWQRKRLFQAGVPLIDVPDKDANSADRVIICDMFSFALENRPPSFIMLLSGDGDFVNAFQSLRASGYTLLLVSPRRGSLLLRSCCHYSFLWEKVLDNTGFQTRDGKLQTRARELKQPSKPKAVRELGKKGVATCILWDMNSCRLPDNISHENAAEYINDYLEEQPIIPEVDFAEYRIYGSEENFPDLRTIGKFIPTSTDKHKKHHHTENNITADMLSFAFDYPPPSNIVVISGNEKLSWVVHVLENLGYTMIVWVPKRLPLLEDAATISTRCDWGYRRSKRLGIQNKRRRLQ